VARRCLITLVELGYVGQHERKFLLRPAVLTIGSAFLASMQIEQVVLSPLQGLRDQTGDSASLTVLSGTDILYVAHVSTDRRFRVATGVGTRFPFHATSLGKALAAHLPEGERESLIAGAPFQRFTERTVTDGTAMTERLNLIASRGYDSALDELDYGIVSVAVPIFGRGGRVIASINCSTSTTRISQDELVRTRLPLLREAAGEIEASLKRWPALEASLRP
jgi:IclR family pca regulon transcriptional regulator